MVRKLDVNNLIKMGSSLKKMNPILGYIQML